ncbi:DMT family transporter [Amycolatopsis sp. NPDC059021]|uniref:DMT family transporter n=1 Tax=Amycolatopsis sp. NPDC059021 TaxID=3346704 RepID=UPI0036729BB9
MPRKKSSFVVAAPLAFVLMWASGPIAVETGLSSSSAPTFLLLRALGSAALCWGVWFFVRDRLPRTGPEWTRTVVVAILLQTVYQGFFFAAVGAGLPAGIIAVILGTQPILTTLITRPGRDRRFRAGLVIGLAGVVLTVSSALGAPSRAGTASMVTGLLFAFLALGAITGGTIVQGRTTNVGTWAALAIQYSISSAAFAVTTACTGGPRLTGHPAFFLALGWMVVVVSVGAAALLYFMVARGEVARVTSLFYCVPPVTALLDLLFSGTALTAVELAGIGLVVVAVALIRTGTSRFRRTTRTDTAPEPAAGAPESTKDGTSLARTRHGGR